MKRRTRLWVALAALVALSPLGLLLPAWLGGGTAWGEWSAEEVQALVGYLPAGMRHLGNLWHAPLPDYALPGQAASGARGEGLAYIVCAAFGVVVVAALSYGAGRLLARREARADDT